MNLFFDHGISLWLKTNFKSDITIFYQQNHDLFFRECEAPIYVLHDLIKSSDQFWLKEMIQYIIAAARYTLFSIADESGNTPCHVAIIQRKGELILEQLKYLPGFFCSELLAKKNGSGESVISLLVKHGRLQFLELTIQYFSDKKALQLLVNEKNNNGDTLLHYAINNRSPKIVLLLLEGCPQPFFLLKAKNKQGNTPLHLAAMRDNARKMRILIEFLQNHFNYMTTVEIQVMLLEKNGAGQTVLDIAMQNTSAAVLQYLSPMVEKIMPVKLEGSISGSPVSLFASAEQPKKPIFAAAILFKTKP